MEEQSSVSKPSEIIHREVQFYDSDEEFGFGPMTLREAKTRLQKPLESSIFIKPSVRHTFYQLFENSESSNMMRDTDQFEKDDCDSIPTISSYLTSSEGANNMNNPGSTNYYSIVESNAGKSLLDLSTKGTEPLEDPDNPQANETLARFIQKAQIQPCVEIENEHLTLINHTIEGLSDSSDESDDSDLAHVINLSSDDGNLIQEDACKDDSDHLVGTVSTSSAADISIPDIDLQQFNESCGLLDTTLDRINAILGQEPEPLENEKENDSAEKDTSSIQCNIISSSHLQKYKENIFEDQLETPKLKQPTAALKSGSSKYTPEFKKPVVTSLPKCIGRTNPNLKDIVSPVRMYIKNSPRPILKQNVNSMTKLPILRATHTPIKKNKENSTVLPNVVYTPAHKQKLESNESFHLPPSLDKMIKKGVVIKHVSGSRNLHPNETLNPEAELTQNILSSSSTASDGDISFLHRKVTVRKD